jgi:iron complex outermembrane receptor protein
MAYSFHVAAQTAAVAPVKSLGVVTVSSGQPTSLPTHIPTTIEGVTREQIDNTVAAYDSEDALRYFPSLLVRKRYIGDYNHAMLSSRASGTSNSPRSMVFADGIPLSNLLGSGVGTLSYAPRWNMVSPEEIDRVDVMYGPFSAAYPGNSVGAVVDYVTRMPKEFQATVKLQHNIQPFSMYNSNETYGGTQGAFTLGNKSGDWSWFLAASRTDSNGQPQTFKTVTPTSTTSTTSNGNVTGALSDRNTSGAPIYVLGTGTQYHTIQDQTKLKLAYDVSSTMKATYQLGLWQNTSENRPTTYLRNSAGQPVYSGSVNVNGNTASLLGTDFALSNEQLLHAMHGFSLKTNTQGVWDWELAASLYDYAKDEKRNNGATNTSSNPLPSALSGGAGTIASGKGSGWNTLALKGTWRPEDLRDHVVDMGLQQDQGNLNYRVNNTDNWISGSAGVLNNAFAGKSNLLSAFAQDTWAFAPRWKTVLGLRAEQWSVFDGRTDIAASGTNSSQSPTAYNFERREEFYLSPKAAVSNQWRDDTVLKASVGRAVRMPTLSELYGATTNATNSYYNDPNLKPEKSFSTELSMEKDTGKGLLRVTFFAEETKDSIYSQISYLDSGGTISRVSNVDRILTKGLELAYSGFDVFTRGLDLWGSITYADSKIIDNTGYITSVGDTIGKMQPNIPTWRASALANYKVDERWNLAMGARYSGPQFRTLNNADINGYTYMGVSEYFTTDIRARYKVDKHWVASFAIDNLNNYQYWNFHPYPQRNYTFELKYTH